MKRKWRKWVALILCMGMLSGSSILTYADEPAMAESQSAAEENTEGTAASETEEMDAASEVSEENEEVQSEAEQTGEGPLGTNPALTPECLWLPKKSTV